jgi:transposase
MGYSRKQIQAIGFDEVEWQHYYHRRQQSYIRLKLQSIKLYWEGQSVEAIATELHLSSKSIRIYIRQYIEAGLAGLAQPTRRAQPSALSLEQRTAFKTTLLTSCPQDHGLEGRIWTGHQMKQYLENTYQLDYTSGIYHLLERLNLSHQKAHAHYANADVVQQQAFLVADEKTAVVAFDEFSVSEKPTAAYGWAEKNTRPTFKTDEKKGTAPMGS